MKRLTYATNNGILISVDKLKVILSLSYNNEKERCTSMATELKQTKNSFKFIGKVSRIDKDGAFKEEVAKKGKKEGETYRSLRFGVKTSENNEMTVQMYDFEPTEVFLWNSDKRKADKNYKGTRVPFEEWVEEQNELREQGFAVLQSRVGLTYNEEGKIDSQGLPSFVASKKIFDNLSNNDSVVIEGTIRYSTYKNKEDKEVPQTTFTIQKIFKLKDVDFENEKFEEVTYFEQEMVFVSADLVKEEKKVYVTGRTIEYNKSFHDSQFVVDYSDGADGENADMKKLATAFLKKFKFGDVINVFGEALNRVIVAEAEDTDEEEDEDLASLLGGKSKPKHAQSYVTRTYISEMQIQGVDVWDKKVYKEEDFVKDELVEEDDLTSELGGKKKDKGTNPFDADDDIDDEELPF